MTGNRDPFRATTVVGNPLSPSRTRVAADHFSAVLGELGADVTTVDLATVPVDGLAHGRPEPVAEAALDALRDADLVLAVTPIYKGTYTGLLKILFDGLAGEALSGKVAVPVVVGAWPGHLLAIEHALKPLFGALGATCPAGGLLVIDKSIDRDAGTVDGGVLADFRRLAEQAVRLLGGLRAGREVTT